MPLDDADEPWCGKGEGHGEHFLSYFRLVSGDFQENNSWLFKHRVFFCFFEFLKDPEAAIFVKGILAFFDVAGGCMVVQQMCRTDVIPLSAVTASNAAAASMFLCNRSQHPRCSKHQIKSRSFSWRCWVRKDGKIYYTPFNSSSPENGCLEDFPDFGADRA